jgi:hypothetical protein
MPSALDPDFVKVEERSDADLLRYLLGYSETLQFFDSTNEPAGHWRALLEKDISSLIVLLSGTDLSRERAALEKLPDVIRSTSDRRTVETAFRGMFEINFAMFIRMNNWYRRIPEPLALHGFMKRLITSGMKERIHDMAALYKGALAPPSLLRQAGDPQTIHEATYSSWEQFTATLAEPVWFKQHATSGTGGTGSASGNGSDNGTEAALLPSWSEEMDAVPPALEAYGPDRKNSAVPTRKKILQALPVLENISEECYKTLGRAVRESVGFLQDTLENYPSHEPHMGLLLAFLRLFGHARDDLNTLTGRHLDFYYSDVLHLKPLVAVPDKVFLIGEVARHLEATGIQKGTLLKAGEDDQKNEVLYEVTRDVFLNKATVSEIKTIYSGKAEKAGVYAAPVANSRDGLGEALDDPLAGWATFGRPQFPDARTMGDALLGFAVASPVLRMAEGERSVYLIFPSETKPDLDKPAGEYFRAIITSDSGWHEAEVADPTSADLSKHDGAGIGLILKIKLGNGEPPVADFDPDLHEGQFAADSPVLKIELLAQDDRHPYHDLRNFRINGCRIAVSVAGASSLVLQNDLGRLDPSKPVMPFGPQPAAGSRFLIGSREIFSKRVTSLVFHLSWSGWPQSGLNDYYKNYGVNFNQNGLRVDRLMLSPAGWTRSENAGFFSSSVEVTSGLPGVENPDLQEFRSFQAGMTGGFVGFELASPDDPFWHKRYRSRLAEFAVNSRITSPPTEPFIPKIGEIKADYEAYADILFDEEAVDASVRHVLHHLYPFGTVPFRQTDAATTGRPFLLPQFTAEIESGSEISDGELFIGLESFQPPQNLSLLFVVKEGSEDPELKETAIRWFYLSRNRWRRLKPLDDYHDETLGLQKTGIITFQIPKVATSGDSLFHTEEPLHWIKASVARQARRFPRLIDIRAQAFPASFRDQDNDPGFLARALPAGTISKFKQSRSDIKSIDQPWASIRGNVAARGTNHYRRVSERLRHKDRGVAIHDYERLVLQKFPDIWLAKCINHSAYDFEEHDDGIITAEFAPGYVTVLLVPDLSNQNIMDPLQPRVSFSKRLEVRNYLRSKLPVFAAEKLSVINPHFEPVQIELSAVFRGDADIGFFKKKLSEDIRGYLSPWTLGNRETFRFGGTIHKSMIVNFVDELAYVDFVTDVRMFHKTGDIYHEVNEAAAASSRSVLTSASKHIILDGSGVA